MIKRAIGIACGAIMAIGGLGACGGSSSTTNDTPSSTPGAAATTGSPTPNLQTQLLTVSDLPAGWSIDNSGSSSSSTPACLKPLKGTNGGKGHVSANFQEGANGLPSLQEALTYFPGTAPQELAMLARTLNSCGEIKFSASGHTYTGTVGQLSVPTLGDQSEAYQLALTAKADGVTVTIGLDLLAIREGSTVIGLIYGDLGTPDIGQFQQLAIKAVAKVST